jgi:predicted Zn-dependent protease
MSNLTLSQAVDYAIELLSDSGGVVVGEVSNTANLRWANSSLTTNGNTVEQSLSVAAFLPINDPATAKNIGTAVGIASGQITDLASVANLVEKSRQSALAAGVAEDANDLPTGVAAKDFHDVPASVDLAELEHIAIGLNKVFENKHSEYFGYCEITIDTLYVATSAGMKTRFEQKTSRFELSAKSIDRKRSAWSGQSGTSLLSVDVHSHGVEVDQGLKFQENQIEIPAGKHKVTLSPSAVADLMIYLMWTASAREASEGRSVFSAPGGGTRIGEQLTTRDFNVVSDPEFPGLQTINQVVSLGSSSFTSTFDTGLPITKSELISKGKLSSLGSSRHAASLAKLPFTPLADNIIVTDTSGTGSLLDTAKRMQNGLLITCLWYIREVDSESLLLTGLTRDGVYVVENGEIIGAASNFRFNESPVGMLNRIVDAGQSIACLPREWADYFARAKVAPLTISDFNLSTKSDAI